MCCSILQSFAIYIPLKIFWISIQVSCEFFVWFDALCPRQTSVRGDIGKVSIFTLMFPAKLSEAVYQY